VAKPQPEEGTIRIANELFTAIVTAPFSKRELKLVLGWIRAGYGWRRTETNLSNTFLAQYTGIHLPDVGNTIKALLAKNVFQEEKGKVRFNKDYEQWRFKGTVLSRKAVAELDRLSGYTQVSESLSPKRPEVSKSLSPRAPQVSESLSKSERITKSDLVNHSQKVSESLSSAPENASPLSDSGSLQTTDNIQPTTKTPTESLTDRDSVLTGRDLVQEFENHYRTAYGSAYDWRRGEFIQANRLVKKHGYEECLRRMQNGFQHEYWFGELRTFGGVVRHFNELVSPPSDKSGRKGRRRPSCNYKGGER
jgi:phage replication O-like protein O